MFIVIAILNQGLDIVEKFSNLGEAITFANKELVRFTEWSGCEDYGFASEDGWFAFGNTAKYDYSVYITEL